MKKIRLPQKKTGIWLDQDKAYLVHLEGEKEPVVETIKSQVESRVRIPGEVKVSTRLGRNIFIDDQEKKQRRQRNERKRYFDDIISKVKDDDYLFLFGPGRGKVGLKKAIEKVHGMRARIMFVETTDRLTKNQMVKKTKDYFNSDNFGEAQSQMKRKLKVIEL